MHRTQVNSPPLPPPRPRGRPAEAPAAACVPGHSLRQSVRVPWLLGVRRAQALSQHQPGTFICRFSLSQPGSLVISCKATSTTPGVDADDLLHAIVKVRACAAAAAAAAACCPQALAA